MKLSLIETRGKFNAIHIREITDDGGYHRRVLHSDDEIAEDEHQEVKDKATEVFTPEIKQAWLDHQEKQLNPTA